MWVFSTRAWGFLRQPHFAAPLIVSCDSQISLWDKIIESPEDTTFNFPFARNKYRLIDQARRHLSALSPVPSAAAAPLHPRASLALPPAAIRSRLAAHRPCARLRHLMCLSQGQNLRGNRLNLTLYWKTMPIVGNFGGGSRTFEVPFALPDAPAQRNPSGSLGRQ